MNDQRLRAAYAAALDRRRPGSRESCPRPEELQALAEGRAPVADRLVLLDHVTACAPCHEDLGLLRAAAAGQPSPWASPAWWGLAAAGLVAVVGLGWWALPRDRGAVMRGGGAVLELVAPGPAVSAGRVTFAWRPVAGASAYDVTVLPAGTEPIAAATTQDTVFTPARAFPAGSYEWSVRALLPDGRVVPSATRRLTITP